MPAAIDITAIEAKTALVRSRIPGVEYVVNPYTGCQHGCSYCYAEFMRKYSHAHGSFDWGAFVEVKANIGALLRHELERKKRKGSVLLASVCDPYQPVEARFGLTRTCIEALLAFGWRVDILTRSPLVTRDTSLLASSPNVSAGFSIPTDDDSVRRVLEPNAPPIPERVEALRHLHAAGISTWVFISPMLPMNPEKLSDMIRPYAGSVLIDSLHYQHKVRRIFEANGWGFALTAAYAAETRSQLTRMLGTIAGCD
jgi:DNA repair photolyase